MKTTNIAGPAIKQNKYKRSRQVVQELKMSSNPKDGEEIKFEMSEDGKDIKYSVDHEDDSGCRRETAKFSMGSNDFLATHWRTPAADPKNIVFLCHGYGEYIDFCWHELAEMLVKNCGSLVISHDHIGHGRSSGTRVHIDSMDDLVDPVIEHIKAVVKLHPGLKTFVYGHSMGGLISLFAIFKKQEMFSGFVASGPLVMPDPDVATPIMRFLAQVLQVVAPYFALKKLEIDQVTRDKDVVARRKEDAEGLLWHGGFRARMSWILMQACDYAQNNLSNLTLPLLVLQGEEDKLVLPSAAKMLVDNAASSDKEYVSYPDAFHNLAVELEPVKKDVLDRVENFINKRTSNAKTS